MKISYEIVFKQEFRNLVKFIENNTKEINQENKYRNNEIFIIRHE
jgi:hypothetical protein